MDKWRLLQNVQLGYYAVPLTETARTIKLLYIAVHGPTQVKITDFGLAKLLECDEESYEATGGKVINYPLTSNSNSSSPVFLFVWIG